MYAQRLEENRKDPRIKHVMLFKNQGGDAGTSIEHTHSQLISLCIVPTDVRDEVEASKRYIRERCSCPLCDTWRIEAKGERRILEDDRVAVFAPYASRFPFQAVIIPKRHTTSLEFLDMDERLSLAFALKQVLSSLNFSLNYPSYNFYFHTAPKGEDLHFHIDICPRISKWAGFELGGGVIINTMPPETAAGHYRDLLKQTDE
jgi:UDPglucose--hexose-1-phosphate uridylyltransferase